MTVTDYTDNLMLLTNRTAQAKFLWLSMEQAARGVGVFVNAGKIEFMRFKQDGAISTLNGKTLKLLDSFTYIIY